MYSRAKKLVEFFTCEEVDFMLKIAREVKNAKLEEPVLYAGSGGDLEHAVILGQRLIFVDSHLPEVTLAEIRNRIERIGGTILDEKREAEPGSCGKHVIRFEFAGEIELVYYGEDATRIGLDFLPEELEGGCSVYFVKVPLPKESAVGSLKSPDSLARALRLIVPGGFYLERECPLCRVLSPELLGFKKIASGYISALSINHNEKGNLYKKLRDVENLHELLELDSELYNKREWR